MHHHHHHHHHRAYKYCHAILLHQFLQTFPILLRNILFKIFI